MTSIRIPRTILACLTAATLALSAMPAEGAPQAEPPSTEVPYTAVEGQVMSYVINTKKANPGMIRTAEKAVQASGGTVVQSWPQIGVIVAHSNHADFLAKIRSAKSPSITSAGPTRTSAVVEGTPGTSAFRPRGASSYKKKPEFTNGDAPVPASPSGGAADPRENEQWDMRMVKADQAHTISQGSPSVLVGVLDSGIDPDHPDLKPNLDVANSINCTAAGQPDRTALAWQNTSSYHGTHVAGTIAAARNGVGIVGVAPDVRMASVKVVNDDGFIFPEYAICGFVWAADRNMDVTNNSYYVDPFEFWCDDQPNQAPAKEAVRRAVAYATGKGVVHAAAAGNSNYDLANKTVDDGSPNDSTPVARTINSQCHDIPAELPGVVTVSAVDNTRTKALFSNYGAGVIDVTAPGASILSTMPIDHPTAPNYALLSGTSMASPHVAGVLALLKSSHPSATPAQLTAMLEAQADDVACPATYPPTQVGQGQQTCTGSTADNSFYGEGMVDAWDAVGGGR